jgi:chromosome partitioning protein
MSAPHDPFGSEHGATQVSATHVSRETSEFDTPIGAAAERAMQVLHTAYQPLRRPPHRRLFTIANQKGGVGKTTTAVNLAAALAVQGLKTLVIDLDPQGNASTALGITERHAGTPSSYEVLIGEISLHTALRRSPHSDRLFCVPATIDLAGAEVHLLSRTGREHVLSQALLPVVGDYHAVLIDCPPSLGVLTINGLTAAEAVIVPLQCEALSHRGVGQLLETIEDVRQFANEKLRVLGLIPTMFDARTTHSRQVLSEVEDRYGLPVFQPSVPKSVRFAEAPGLGRSVLQHAPTSPGAVAYRALSTSVYDAMQTA